MTTPVNRHVVAIDRFDCIFPTLSGSGRVTPSEVNGLEEKNGGFQNGGFVDEKAGSRTNGNVGNGQMAIKDSKYDENGEKKDEEKKEQLLVGFFEVVSRALYTALV